MISASECAPGGCRTFFPLRLFFQQNFSFDKIREISMEGVKRVYF
jgi:hypothetical protein